MKEFSESLPASEFEHVCFNYFGKHMFLHVLMNGQEMRHNNFRFFFFFFFFFFAELYLTEKPSFKILNNNKLKKKEKKKKKTGIGAQFMHSLHLFTKQVKAIRPIDKSEEDAPSEAREFGDYNPVELEITVWWMSSPLTLAPTCTPKMNAVSYTGKTFRCSINLFSISWYLVPSELLALSSAVNHLNLSDRKVRFERKVKHGSSAI